jgi:anti-anti-sigma factor
MLSPVELTRSQAPEQLRLSLSGDIDLATVDLLTTAAARLLAQHPRRLVLDFARVGLCDAAGLGAVARIHRACHLSGCELVLANVNTVVGWVLTIVGMDQLLTIVNETAA